MKTLNGTERQVYIEIERAGKRERKRKKERERIPEEVCALPIFKEKDIEQKRGKFVLYLYRKRMNARKR